jgi:hypothetical protein
VDARLRARADGWFLRSDIIWAKPNGMPESVQDRPTRSHEMVFLLSKSPRYFYDNEALRTPPRQRRKPASLRTSKLRPAANAPTAAKRRTGR